MTCPDNFEVNPLYEAANLPSDRVMVSRKDLAIVCDCCLTNSPEDRTLVHGLGIERPGPAKMKVDRKTLFGLLVRHARQHAAETTGGFGKAPAVVAGTVTGRMTSAVPNVEERPRSNAADALAEALKRLSDERGSAVMIPLVCAENGLDRKEFDRPNVALSRMALGNKLRAMLKAGQAVKVNGLVIA